MSDIHYSVFLVIGTIVTAVSFSVKSMKIFILFGIAFIIWGLIKLFMIKKDQTEKKSVALNPMQQGHNSAHHTQVPRVQHITNNNPFHAHNSAHSNQHSQSAHTMNANRSSPTHNSGIPNPMDNYHPQHNPMHHAHSISNGYQAHLQQQVNHYKKCPNCGTISPKSHRFCPHCGYGV